MTETSAGNKKCLTKEEEIEDKLETAEILNVPDGGFGWVIVAASFMINLIVDGMIFTIGKILIPAWVEYFNISDASASLTTAILSGFYFTIGPLASALCNVFGCRMVALIGSIVASSAFIASAFAPNIYVLYLTFGILAGAGFGMMYLPSIVILSQYFAKKKSLATGIAVCGSGIGTTIFAFVNDHVYSFVGENWQYFLFYNAIVTIFGVLGALALVTFKPTPEKIEEIADLVVDYENSKSSKNRISTEDEKNDAIHETKTPLLDSIEHRAAANHVDLTHSPSTEVYEIVAKDVENVNKPLVKSDVFYSASTTKAHLHDHTGKNTENHINPKIVIIANKDSIYQQIIGALGSLLDKSLLASPAFLLLALSGTLTLTCFYVPFLYLGNHLDKIPNLTAFEKSFPISLIGALNILARIVCGYVSDHPHISALQFSSMGLFLAGLATVTVPFYTAYWQFLLYCLPFSVGVASFAALRSVICTELVGVSKLSNAFGILLTFMGIGAFIGSPIAAALKDYTGNFDASFYIMGTLMAISGMMIAPLPAIQKWEENRNESLRSDAELQEITFVREMNN